MPVTTILQHQRERDRERRPTQPDLDTPMPDHDQTPSVRDELQEVRFQWALGVEERFQVSLLTESEKAAAIAAQWNPPGSSYSVEILNPPFNPDSSTVSTPSTNQGSSVVYNTSQTGGRKLGHPHGTTSDGHNTRRLPPTNHTSKPGAYEVQQHNSQQYPSQDYNAGQISPEVYNVTQRAVNVLWAHRQGEAASDGNTVCQAVPNPRVHEQTAPRIYNTPYTPPASQSSAQTSPLEYNGRQAPYGDYHTGHPFPVERDAVRASPRAPNASEAGSRLGEIAIAPRPQASNATASNQPQRAPGWQDAYPQPTTTPRPAFLQQSVTSSRSVMSLKSIVAPQSPVIVHPAMTPPSERPSQAELAPRLAAPSYPATMPQPQGAVSSQAMAAPQPPVIPQSVYTHLTHSPHPFGWQPAYTQPPDAQPPHSWPYYAQSAFSEPSNPQPCSQPACSQPGCSLCDPPCPYNPPPQPVYSQPVAASQPASVAQPEATPRSLATTHSMIASNPPATPWPAESSQTATAAQQSALPQHATFSQPMPFRTMATSHAAGDPQQLAIRLAAASDSRGSAQKGGGESTKVPQAQDPRSLCNPKGPAIVDMTPSFGNKVADFIMKYDPSMLAGSQVSDTLPKETAVHYKSVLAHQTQSPGLSIPHGCPKTYNSINPGIVSPQVVPASQAVQGMQPTATHTGRTPFQQEKRTGVSPRHGHFDAPAPQSHVQTHPSFKEPLIGSVHYGSTSRVGHPQAATAQQSLNEVGKGMAGAGSHSGYAQEVSQMDWQAANEGTSGRPSPYGAQPFVASVPHNTASQISNSTPTKTQSVPQPRVTNTNHKMPLPKPQRLILASTKPQTAPTKAPAASTRVQASRKAKGQSKSTRASGGVQKRRSNRVRQTTPPRSAAIQPTVPQNAMSHTAVAQVAAPQNKVPQTPLLSSGRKQQPITHVSGSGLGLTQDDVDRWEEERKNPYRLPSFNDAFGHIRMESCSSGHQQTSCEAEEGEFILDAYRI